MLIDFCKKEFGNNQDLVQEEKNEAALQGKFWRYNAL